MSDKIRLVRVLLVDPDKRITDMKKAVLYDSEEHLTDATDQELYFDINVMELLAKHNAYRKTVLDEKATDRRGKDMFLKPIKIRDLTMNVVTIAEFERR